MLVTIEEPHMYAEDDAVAKFDGYVISVAGAGKLVGKKTLVRIEDVGRSAASAVLVDGADVTDAPVVPESTLGGGGPANGAAPKPRRRGRRGGRGRRKASADSSGND